MQGFKELAPYILSQNSTGIRSIRQKVNTHTHVHTGWGEERDRDQSQTDLVWYLGQYSTYHSFLISLYPSKLQKFQISRFIE